MNLDDLELGPSFRQVAGGDPVAEDQNQKTASTLEAHSDGGPSYLGVAGVETTLAQGI